MPTYKSLTLLLTTGLMTIGNATADLTNISPKQAAMKIATITKMYQQDIGDEGMSNPEDLSLLYVLETSDGNKGTLLAGYGINANTDLYEFMSRIPEENNKKREQNISPGYGG